MLHKDYHRKGSVEEKKNLSESQEARREDELIGSKPKFVK
jgi:hypothetical protein